jgi:hypothetical protein
MPHICLVSPKKVFDTLLYVPIGDDALTLGVEDDLTSGPNVWMSQDKERKGWGSVMQPRAVHKSVEDMSD